MHVISAEQFSPEGLDELFIAAAGLRQVDRNIEFRRGLASRYVGRQVCSLFYEPSTRTRLSFEQAAIKLGVGVVSTENAGEFSSAAKGETLEDTIHVLNEYNFDAIILRHPVIGSAARAAAVSQVPIINAGDGVGEHPTQALLDMFTIRQHHHKLDGLTVVMGGDLRNGRTVRSLAHMLAKYQGNKLRFVSVPELQIGEDIKTALDEHEIEYQETVEVYDALREADVVYWTRIQKERLEHPEAIPSSMFVIDSTALEVLPQNAILMHPLPRVGEIAMEVDSDPRAKYFQQAGNGLYVRMALLDSLLKD